MGVREKFRAELARQLGRPEGLRGRFVGSRLNRHNRGIVTAAVEATGLVPGQTAADIGFGGGVGLPLLLDRVLPAGHVYGVDLSDTMLARARGNFRDEVAEGSLTLLAGSITALPLSEASLHAAITVNTIYFVTDLDKAFAELARVLRPGGRVVVGLADPVAMATVPFTSHGFILRPVDDVAASLTGAGLAPVDHRRIGGGESAHHLLVAGSAPSSSPAGSP